MATKPTTPIVVPPGACDTHMHIYGTPGRSLDDYRKVRDCLGFERTVFVQASDFATDNSLVLDCIAAEDGRARGIAVIDPNAPEADLRSLHEGGIRGVRFHDIVPGCLPYEVLEPVAARIAVLGWHVIVQSEGDRLPELEPRLRNLAVDFVIDHMGRVPVDGGVDHPAFQVILRLLESGRCWVKLSAPYHVSRTGGPGYDDLRERGWALVAAAPERMLWGSNWPHPSIKVGPMPDYAALLDVLGDWAGDEATVARILVDNPATLYGFL